MKPAQVRKRIRKLIRRRAPACQSVLVMAKMLSPSVIRSTTLSKSVA